MLNSATDWDRHVLDAEELARTPGFQRLRDEIVARFQMECLLDEGGRVLVESEKGHELIPRLVEGLQGLRIDSVSLRRPTLADAFLKVTGRQLAADAEAA